MNIADDLREEAVALGWIEPAHYRNPDDVAEGPPQPAPLGNAHIEPQKPKHKRGRQLRGSTYQRLDQLEAEIYRREMDEITSNVSTTRTGGR